jgi:hypothetical protein
VVPAAGLAGEDVHDDGLARANRLAVVAAVVRHARVAAHRHDALAVLGQAVLGERAVDERANVAEAHDVADAVAEVPVEGLERAQVLRHPLHRVHRAARALADLLQLGLFLGLHRLVDHVRLAAVHHDRRRRGPQVRQHRPGEAHGRLAEERDLALEPQLARDLADQLRERLGLRFGVLEHGEESVLGVRGPFVAGVRGLVAFHRVHDQVRVAVGGAHVKAVVDLLAGAPVEGGAIAIVSEHDEAREPALAHEAVEVGTQGTTSGAGGATRAGTGLGREGARRTGWRM